MSDLPILSVESDRVDSEEWSQNKALCEYCRVATLASIVCLGLALPEVTTAVKSLLGQKEEESIAHSSAN